MTRLLFTVAVFFINSTMWALGAFAHEPETDAFSRPALTDPFKDKFLVFETVGETTIHEDVRLHLLGGNAFLVLRPAQLSRSGQSTPVYQEWLRLSSHARFNVFETRAEAERFIQPTIEKLKALNEHFPQTSLKTFQHPEELSDPLHSKGIIIKLGKSTIMNPGLDLHVLGTEYFLSLKAAEQEGQSYWFPFLSVDRIVTFNSAEEAMAFEGLIYPKLKEGLDKQTFPNQK